MRTSPRSLAGSFILATGALSLVSFAGDRRLVVMQPGQARSS